MIYDLLEEVNYLGYVGQAVSDFEDPVCVKVLIRIVDPLRG